jgi:PAS domain S-box-containing protein
MDPSFLAGGGESGELMRRLDWAGTPLGPADRWPQALKTAVRIVLTSRQPMFVWWGDDLINLYNDAYRSILGGKHPQALGQPASVVWREIWDQVEPRAMTAMFKNEGTYDEALLLIMERYGYPEETHYTFSYSPVPNDEGGTGGIFCANTDDTDRIIGERQLALLRELASRTADARTLEEACALSARSLDTNPWDLPFSLIYLLDQGRQRMVLAGSAGIPSGHPGAPPEMPVEDDRLWPFEKVLATNAACIVDDLAQAGPMPSGLWGQPPRRAVALPIPASGQTGRSGVLIAGLNPYRIWNDSYQGFVRLVSGQIAAAIANAQAYEAERQRAESLAELDRAKTAFFSNVSHEFRTPLTLLLGPLEEVLARGDGGIHEDDLQLVDVAHRNGLRLLKLVNTLLDFSRIEAGRVQASYQPTDLSAITCDLASSFRSTVEKAGLRFIVACPPLPQPVYVDREMWEKIVLNLISNAFKYTFEGEIAVKTAVSPDGAWAMLLVHDTGTGIAAEELPRLFERFHRVEGARGRTHEGTGIGLALVQELVRLHGGSVTVESEWGKGSTFTVQLPFGAAHLQRDRVYDGPSAVSTATRPETFVDEAERWLPRAVSRTGDGRDGDASGRPRILLADDNADMREYLGRLLASRYQVTSVSNGQDALSVALQKTPDLVLSDVMMPALDGFGLVSRLRDNPATRTVPVILLSARAGEEARIEGLQSGADDYLVKPFTARELLARLETHLRMSQLRQQVAQAVLAAEERFRLAVESADLGTWDHDLITGKLHCSDRFNRICGLPEVPITRTLVNECVHPEDRDRTRREYEQALADHARELFQSEFRVALPDGSIRWVVSKGKLLFEQNGNDRRPVRVVGTLQDITDRKRSEEALREVQKLESLGLLAGGIAHDFNNLLTGIIGNASLLETEFAPTSPQGEAARCMMETADRMARLTGQMLAYSGRGRFVVEHLNVAQHVRQIVGLIQASIPKTVELRLQLDSDVPCIEADAAQLQQVIMNLVINAAEAITGAGVVEVRTADSDVSEAELRANVTRQRPPIGRYVELTVKDNGQGMDPATLARIFDPFFTTKFTGRGLGLAAVLGIVRGHGGLLTVDSRPGEGTTFRVFFPVARGASSENAVTRPALEQGSGTVLVVDDEDLVRTTARIALTQAGYRVVTARDGEEAVRIFHSQPDEIDLVLLDMTMPVMGGEEALRRIAELRPDVAVLASSGYDETEAQQRFGSRIAGFLQKPYTGGHLTGTVGRILRRN